MSAVFADTRSELAPVRLCLLGTGGVGRALLARLANLQSRGLAAQLQLVGVANSRRALAGAVLDPMRVREQIDAAAAPSSGAFADDALVAADSRIRRIVIDATASDAVAARHAHWLGAGIDVVSANKLGQGVSLLRWQAIRTAQALGRSSYGDAATVGAGLPLLRSLRALVAGGDRIDAIAGVLSGSLAWLCDRFDGTRPFSDLVREAHSSGYSEPDPRDDLSGADLRRKLLILVRAAGVALDAHEVQVTPLLDAVLASVEREHVDAALTRLDAPMQRNLELAQRRRARLRVVARWREGRASVALEALRDDDALAGGAGTDNRLAIHSSRYRDRPLLIQGPGAGADVTAAALLDDVLSIASSRR